ncbi:MAG: response regulator [Chloroflexota bacterium]
MSKSILIVDDDRVSRTLYTRILQHAGFSVHEAIDGADGLQKAREITPDLMILDLVLPKIDGFTLCQTLREEEDFARLPIFFISGRADKKMIERGFDSGATDYLTKPIRRQDLLMRIEATLSA